MDILLSYFILLSKMISAKLTISIFLFRIFHDFICCLCPIEVRRLDDSLLFDSEKIHFPFSCALGKYSLAGEISFTRKFVGWIECQWESIGKSIVLWFCCYQQFSFFECFWIFLISAFGKSVYKCRYILIDLPFDFIFW